MPAKKLKGTVVSNKMEKSAVVQVVRKFKHPRYQKYVQKRKKYYAHDGLGVREGDEVIIEESRPRSKLKRWKIIKKLDA
ncbi:30S ribosomal protein S17 [candidate division CPR3 bacterium 4484_211]|uniref:Small ribosomal subunit protein uS17 n=1 Tax=candidate division CPR3 bacterium 4484_211 TaxID=1968527 RepID=A0A1W9NZQ0_UNCC3|nr:MAG: 30S ribosomal protein S17 [candidate division CPR3 bacterium 4484_211]